MQDNNNTTITRLSQLDMNGVYTYADYLMWQINERLELIKGKILKMAAPSSSHQSVALNITTQMHAFLRNSSCKVFVAPFDVRFLLEK